MKVGCTAWAFSEEGYGAPYEDIIDTVADLGFDGIELIIFSRDDLENYYTPARVKALRKQMKDRGLQLSEMAVYDSVVNGLASLDQNVKEEALETFEECAKIGKELGTGIMNMVSQWPQGIEALTSYPPHAIYTEMSSADKFSPKLTIELPDNFNWDEIWDNYIDSITKCTEIVKDLDMKFALEGHCHVIVSHTDSFLRVFDQIDMDELGTNFDLMWQFKQREYLPMSIRKLNKKIFHVHARDGDGLYSYSLPPGYGITDWDEVIKALKAIDYDGFLSLEMGGYENPEKYTKEGLDFLREVIAKYE